MSSERIFLSSDAQKHIDAYVEYKRIVGEADGGKLLSPAEYEEFKKTAAERSKNRLYVYWCNPSGLECRAVGPSSLCFCEHRYSQHNTDNVDRKVNCKHCKCPAFDYVAVRGSADLRCHCKHSFSAHDATTKARMCKQCSKCLGFKTSVSCACGASYSSHVTVFQSRAVCVDFVLPSHACQEREALGRPVDNLAGGGEGYEALGGIINFSSLVDGIDRLEAPSAPPARQIKAPEGKTVATRERKSKPAAAARSSSGARVAAVNTAPQRKPKAAASSSTGLRVAGKQAIRSSTTSTRPKQATTASSASAASKS